MIKANFNTYNNYVTDSLYQWDVNQDLIINGLNLSVAPEIHFANANMDRAIVRQSALEGGVITVRIPNSLLQEALTIKAYVGIYEGETFKVIETIEIPLIAKTKPADYVIEDSDEEIYSFNQLDNRISNIIANANPTSGNSELVDIRIGADGTKYLSAGAAVRDQVDNLRKDVDTLNQNGLILKDDFIGEKVDEWLDDHPEATTTVQDKSLTSEKFTDELKLSTLKDYGTPEMFGAVGDGVTDDTDAIQNAVNSYREVRLLKEYKITRPIVLPANTSIYGGKVIKENDSVHDLNDKSVNAIFIVNGTNVSIQNSKLVGSIENNVSGIAFGNNAIMFNISRVKITNCYNGLIDVLMCFMGAFENVHCTSCLNGFNLVNVEKTSLTLKNCWCENCGQAYDFKTLTYSTLQNCGADYCNYMDESNPYGSGRGNKASNKGVYYFELCHNVSVINCGAETCYAASAIDVRACIMTIDGLTVHNLKSEYLPEFTSDPNWGLGVIYTRSEISRLSIKNIYVTGFTNEVLSQNYPDKSLSIVAYNYSSRMYGVCDDICISIESYKVEGNLPVFNGQGDYSKNCIDLTKLKKEITYSDSVGVGYMSLKATKTLSGENCDTIVIPFLSQYYDWRPQVFTLTGFSDSYNEQVPNAFTVTIAVSTLTSLKNITILHKSNENITVTSNGMNLSVKLPDTYSKMSVDCIIHSSKSTMLWDDVALS